MVLTNYYLLLHIYKVHEMLKFTVNLSSHDIKRFTINTRLNLFVWSSQEDQPAVIVFQISVGITVLSVLPFPSKHETVWSNCMIFCCIQPGDISAFQCHFFRTFCVKIWSSKIGKCTSFTQCSHKVLWFCFKDEPDLNLILTN